jgi:diguanylate cyclase (GGDEF)-like protein/PAS domain S-box-containing protein
MLHLLFSPVHRFGGRLIIIISAVLALFFVIFSVLAAQLLFAQHQNERLTLLTETAQHMAARLDEGMFAHWRNVQMFANLPVIRDPLTEWEDKRVLLEYLQSAYPAYAWLGLSDKEGYISVASGGVLEGRAFQQQTWFIQGRQNPYIGDVHEAFLLAHLLPLSRYDNGPLRLLDLAAPIYAEDGEWLGVLVTHLSWQWAAEMRARLLKALPQGSAPVEVIISNRDGAVRLGVARLPADGNNLELDSVRQAAQGKSGAHLETWHDGIAYLTAYAPTRGYHDYPGLGWIVLVRQEAASWFPKAWPDMRRNLAFGLLFTFLFALLSAAIIARLSRPVHELGRTAEAIIRGTQRPHFPVRAGTDETALIARALDKLMNDLKHQRGELELAARVFEESAEGIMITDKNQRIIRVNQAFQEITGYSRQEALGNHPGLLRSGRHDLDFYRNLWMAIEKTGYWQGEIWNRRKNGEIYPEWLTINTLRDADGASSHYIGIFSDISKIKAAEEHIRYLAHHDVLTNLPNRLLVTDRLEQALFQAQREERKIAILFIDLDFFKHINDSLGHAVGDQVLQESAARLRACLPPSDTVARLGGDEFVIITYLAQVQEIAHLAETLLSRLYQTMRIEQHHFNISASIGICLYPDNGDSAQVLMQNADTAMYHAKSNGRHQFQFFTQEMNRQVQERMMLENELRHALAKNELEVYYQPQRRLSDNRLVGVEALLRWHHPHLGQIPPLRFIPVAEETGQIIGLGEWVLRSACIQHCRWREQGLDLRVAVNLSPVQFRDRDLPQRIAEILAETGMQANYLELEITENMLIDSNAATTIHALRAMGIQIALDDFGTGYSNLSYIKQFAIDKIKIDQSFVREMNRSPNDAQIISAIINLTHSLKLQVIAEGVEHPDHLAFLKAHACDEAQGFYLSKPVPAADILLAAKNS